MAAAAVLTVFTVIAPTSAYADTNDQELVNVESGLRADVMWASTAPYTGVFLWPEDGSASQQFDLLDSGGGYFRIRARHSGQCLMLDWRAGYYANGTRIIQYPYCNAGYAPAEWYTRWVEIPPQGVWAAEWHQVIVNRQTGKCLDTQAPSGNPSQQAPLQQWDCITSGTDWNRWNQMWEFESPPGPLR
ncbi:RICIN domain-containing protein [Streptacidiphilus sp. PAMC 29251]